MRQLFDIDGPVMSALGQITNYILLSFLWLLFCIPVITIGASTSALYYVTLKMARKETLSVAGSFFKALRENLGQGIIFTIIFGAIGAVLFFDYSIMLRQDSFWGVALRVVFMALTIFYLITMMYTFPLQAQFENSIRGTLKNAFYFSFQNIRITLAALGIHAVPALAIFLPMELLCKILPVLLLALPALIAWLCSLQYMKIFKIYMEKEKEQLSA